MSTDMHSACQPSGGSARRPGRARRGRRHHLLASRLGRSAAMTTLRRLMSTNFIEKIDDDLLPERFAPLTVTQLMPNFGARISGVDLTADLSDDLRALLRQAWLTYGVVIFTDQQKLSGEQHLEIVTIFG